MKILIIGGTGAIGAPLTKVLAQDADNEVHTLARKKLYVPEMPNVEFIMGDAFNDAGMERIVRTGGYDVIIDFMIYNVESFQSVIERYAHACKQYICMGTSSVYASVPVGEKITEETVRLYDRYSEERKNNNSIYHILKSNLDNVIFASNIHNWTLVRPYVTFNVKKFPLVTWPKEVWLYRVLSGKKVVLPKDVMDSKTTVTFGEEVAVGIKSIIGKKDALGEVFNIASNISLSWHDLLEKYQLILPEICGKKIDVFWVEESKEIWKKVPSHYDLFVNDRLLNREFDTDKLDKIAGYHVEFTDISYNLKRCLEQLFSEKEYKILPDPAINGYMDKITKEHTSLREFSGLREKVLYLANRYTIMEFVYKALRKCKRIAKNMVGNG